MASIVTNRGKRVFVDGTVDWDTTTLKGMLLASSYTPNADHSTVDQISASEISVSGYTGGFGGAGRATLASKTVTQDNTNDRVDLDAADISHGALGAGATIGFLAIIREQTNDAGSDVLAILEYSATTPTNGGAFTTQFAAAGALRAA
jgi:hypothetical protein